MATAQNTDWLKSSQQYWDTWFEAQRKAFGAQPQADTGFQTPWMDFFREWQSKVSGSEQPSHTEVFQQYFTKAGETYLNMLQQFYQGTGQAKPLDQMAREWTENLQKFFTDAFQTNSQPFDVSAGYKTFTDAFTKTSESWANFAQNQSRTGTDPLSAFDPLGFFASMPGIGYSREKQEQLNHLYQQWVEFQRKTRAYDAGMAKVGIEAVQKFQEFLANPPKDQEPLTSLKAVYTKWVDVCEGIYAKYAMTEEYTTLYGEVVNALMNFKKQQNKITDDLMDQMNLPTRKEVDSLHERVHALRRDNLQLKKDIAELKAALKPKTATATAPAKKSAKKGKKS